MSPRGKHGHPGDQHYIQGCLEGTPSTTDDPMSSADVPGPAPAEVVLLNHSEIVEIAQIAAEAAVAKVLLNLDVDITDRDAVMNFRENSRHTTRQRKGIEALGTNVFRATVTVLVGAALVVILAGIRWAMGLTPASPY